MKTKTIVLAFLAVTAGVFAYTRPHNAMPSDLRDAVADNAEFNTSIPVFEKGSGNIPEPKAAKVMSDVASEKAVEALPPGQLDRSAADALSALPGETPYEKVKNLFANGVPATAKDLAGWHAGRMISARGVISARLIVYAIPKSPSGASLLARPNKYLFRTGKDEVDYSYFDDMGKHTLNWLKEIDMMSPDRYWDLKFPEAMVILPLGDGFTITTLEVRKAHGYIVERMSLESRFMPADHTKNRILYSFYFKDVTHRE